MKLARVCHLPLLISVFGLYCGTVLADTVLLKTGESVEGKVLSETETSITLEYNLTPKIKDTRIINKSDIKELTRLTPAQTAFKEGKLAELLPTPDLLGPGDYERIIQDQLRTFVVKFPGTPQADEAETIIQTLSEEKQRVANGELKVDGKWLDAQTVKRDVYAINAFRLRHAMKKAAAEAGELRNLKALRLFERLRTEFPASLSFVDAIPDAMTILDSYEKQLTAMIAEQPILAQKRESALKSLVGPDAALTRKSIEDETKAFKQTYDAQKKANVKWTDIYKYEATALKEALGVVGKEKAELHALDINTLRSENETLRVITLALADEKVEEATSLLSKLPKATMMNKDAVAALETQARELEESLKKRRTQKMAAAVTAEATATAPSEDGAPRADSESEQKVNALAEALRKAQQKDGSDGKADEKKPAEAEKAKNEAAAAASPEAAKPAPALPVEETEESSITSYIPYLGGVLLIVLLVAYVLGKRKEKKEPA